MGVCFEEIKTMGKQIVVYNLTDKSIVGYYGFSDPATTNLYPRDPATQGKIELPDDHPSQAEQHKWKVSRGKMVRVTAKRTRR